MKSNIATNDLNRSDLTTEIGVAINRAIKHFEPEHFWFKETSSTCATVANQQTLSSSDTSPLPSTIKEIDYIEITINSNIYRLDRKSIQEILDLTTSATDTGQPIKYAFYQKKLYFYPIPSAIYTITVFYTKSYTELSADADTNDWTTEAEDLIEARACWWINYKILKDTEEATIYKAAEIEALQELREKTSTLLSSGKIQSTQF